MRKLSFIIILTTLAFIGYDHYSKIQQEIRQQQLALEIYERDKKALEAARLSADPKAIQNFIHQYPDSAWIESARYHLEKQILDIAVKARNINALKRFTETHPNSVWKQTAIDYQEKFLLEEKSKLTRQKTVNTEHAEKAHLTDEPVITYQQPSTTVNKPDKQKAMDRVNRALSIYQKINKQKAKTEEQQKLQREQQADREKRCNRLKDQLKQFKSNVRWYELDEQGKRIYMDKQTINERRKELRDNINQYCQ